MTKELERQAWLEERKTGVGSSDAPGIVGVAPWSTPLQIYCEKLGLYQPEETEQMKVGREIEPFIAGLASERLGLPLTQGRLVRHPFHRWLIATPDYHLPDGTVVEIKNCRSSEGWGAEMTDHIPIYYLVQVIHQMMVTQTLHAYCAAFIAGCELRLYRVQNNPRVNGLLFRALEDFWKGHVEARLPPPVDYQDRNAARLLNLLSPPVEARALEMDLSDQELTNEYLMLTSDLSRAIKRQRVLRNRLVARMGDCSKGITPNGHTVTRSTDCNGVVSLRVKGDILD